MKVLTMNTRRNGYSVDQCGRTLTVGELIAYLEQWDEDTKVFYSNDNGYTYGSINFNDIDEKEIDDELDDDEDFDE